MKQVGQNYKTGKLELLEVPAPTCRPGTLLVRTSYSLISMGTEMMKVDESKLSLLGKARARPDQVRKVIDSISQHGLSPTVKKTRARLDSWTPLGYSLSGVVEEVGEGIEGFSIGQRVACAGNEFAFHAELNRVPRNLTVPVPDGVNGKHAAFTTVGAVAVQAYRRAEPQLGETAVVIGLGLVGQLLCQILQAAGVSVVGVDISEERCDLAESLGVIAAAAPQSESGKAKLTKALHEASNGFGADSVFLAMSTTSREPVELAAELARDRARIVDIGKTNLDLPWDEYYAKELDVRFSRSYGPGRYDPVYETGGVDYPIGYVRWTEERNMRSFLDLVARGAIDLDPLTSHVAPFETAVETYEALHQGTMRGVGVLFEYGNTSKEDHRSVGSIQLRAPAGLSVSSVRLGVIGAGSYATSMLLPHLLKCADVQLRSVATATALSAVNAQKRFGFEEIATDHRQILEDDSINAVLIATRHDSHSELVVESLQAGKAVFVEKPLAITDQGLAEITDAIRESGNTALMVGFNRRFSPLLNSLRDLWGGDISPTTLRYTVNAGRLDADSWYTDATRQGSRFVGEGGHFIDTVSWWLRDEPGELYAASAPDDSDNVIVILRYPDGSTATVEYLTGGSRNYPKETFMAIGGGNVARMKDFRRSEFWGGKSRKSKSAGRRDKGQKAEMEAFVDAVKRGGEMPISLRSLISTTAATLAVSRSLRTGKPEQIPLLAVSDLGRE